MAKSIIFEVTFSPTKICWCEEDFDSIEEFTAFCEHMTNDQKFKYQTLWDNMYNEDRKIKTLKSKIIEE